MRSVAIRLLITLGVCSMYSTSINGQNLISGKVIDSVTHETLPLANIYFANTLYRTVTSDSGTFSLRGFPSGKYDLTISFVGYKTFQQSFDFADTSREVTILLAENATRLDEVVISPDTSKRAYYMSQFKRSFLGDTKNAAACRIVNQKNIFFAYDEESKILSAFSRKPLEIINDALGYKLIYDLQLFEIDYSRYVQSYIGIPSLISLEPESKSQARKWERERKRAYYGSFLHFIHLLTRGGLQDNFEIHELLKVPNPARPSSAVLDKKIMYWRSQGSTSKNNKLKTDSLAYYRYLKSKPEFIDSIGRKLSDTMILDSARSSIIFKGSLYVIYKHEEEESMYGAVTRGYTINKQHSTVLFRGNKIYIYNNGYFEDSREVFFDGYMGWSEKISNLVPLDYVPPD